MPNDTFDTLERVELPAAAIAPMLPRPSLPLSRREIAWQKGDAPATPLEPLSDEAIAALQNEFIAAVSRRLRNRSGMRGEIESSAPVSHHTPPRLMVYMTRKCNARCLMCHGVEGGLIDHHISPEDNDVTFDDFMTRFGPWLPNAEKCDLYGLGEVLLFPETIFQMMAELQKHRALISLVTNGVLLTPITARRLANLGLGRVVVSLDAVTPTLYEEIRQGLHWPVLDRNLRFILGEDVIPIIEFNFVVMRRNLDEMEMLLDYIHEHHRGPAEVSISFYLLQILKTTEFFRKEVLYSRDEPELRRRFASLQARADRYGYRINLPELVKLKQADAVYPDEAAGRAVGPSNLLQAMDPAATLDAHMEEIATASAAVANAMEEPLAACSRPWDTFFLLPSGKGKVCCDNPVPVQSLGDRNGVALQRLRTAVNDPKDHARYKACRFCAERPRSDYSTRVAPPLELAFPETRCQVNLNGDAESVWKLIFPTLLGDWETATVAETECLIARRDTGRFSDFIFRAPAGSPAILFLEFVDAENVRVELSYVENGAHVSLGAAVGAGTNALRQESFYLPSIPRGQRGGKTQEPLRLILETHGSKFPLSKISLLVPVAGTARVTGTGA